MAINPIDYFFSINQMQDGYIPSLDKLPITICALRRYYHDHEDKVDEAALNKVWGKFLNGVVNYARSIFRSQAQAHNLVDNKWLIKPTD